MPRVSVVIPSLDGDVAAAAASLDRQTFTDWELIVVTGVRPAGRARNQGVARSTGELVLFLDDDAELGHARVLEQMVAATFEPDIGVVGSSKVLPPDSSRFQRRVAREVPRWVFPVLDAPLVSNPPIGSYGFSAATTTCCLVPRRVLDEVGGFDERLPTGEDPELFYRIRRAGYRFIVPADCWAYHPSPASLRELVRKSFRYGVGNALEARLGPDRHMNVVPLDRPWGKLALVVAPILLPASVFLSIYLEPRVQLKLGVRPLKAISTFATLYGYAWGHFRGRA